LVPSCLVVNPPRKKFSQPPRAKSHELFFSNRLDGDVNRRGACGARLRGAPHPGEVLPLLDPARPVAAHPALRDHPADPTMPQGAKATKVLRGFPSVAGHVPVPGKEQRGESDLPKSWVSAWGGCLGRQRDRPDHPARGALRGRSSRRGRPQQRPRLSRHEALSGAGRRATETGDLAPTANSEEPKKNPALGGVRERRRS